MQAEGEPRAGPTPAWTPSSLPADAYRVIASVAGWGAFAGGCLVWGVSVVPVTLALLPFWPGVREPFHALTRAALLVYFHTLLFMRVEVEGAEHRLAGPRVVVANHQSLLDSILLISLEPRLAGPSRSYMFRIPIVRTILRLAGFHPADAGELPSLERMRAGAEEARARGGGLLFFPEGTRSRSGAVGAFHRGAFRVAVDHALPIQPVVIEGLDRVLPPGRFLVVSPWRPVVRVRYLEPLRPPYGAGVRREVVRALASGVRETLVAELARLRARRG